MRSRPREARTESRCSRARRRQASRRSPALGNGLVAADDERYDERVKAASPTRPRTSVAGLARTPTLMNMNEAPQMSARPMSIVRWRRFANPTRRRVICFSCSAVGRPGTLDHLTQVAEQPLHRALGLTGLESDRSGSSPRPEPFRAGDSRCSGRSIVGTSTGAAAPRLPLGRRAVLRAGRERAC